MYLVLALQFATLARKRAPHQDGTGSHRARAAPLIFGERFEIRLSLLTLSVSFQSC